MSVKKPKLTVAGVLTGIGSGAPTPTAAYKRGEVSLTPKVDVPEETQAQKDLETQQRLELIKLDAAENERRKRLLSAMQGTRAFRGSAIYRNAQATQNTGAVQGGTASGRMFAGGSGSSVRGDAGVTAVNSR